MRSGTSIGANVEEAIGGQNRKDFTAKICIAYKEARETMCWLELLEESFILEAQFADSIKKDCKEICRIIGKIQITCNKRGDV